MFYLRGALVCTSLFVLVYVCASALVGRWWRGIVRAAGPQSERASANILFALRMTPVISGTLLVVAFALPSFVSLEPRTGQEAIGPLAVLLSAAFIALATSGAGRVWWALRHTRNCVRQWTCHAEPEKSSSAMLISSPGAPPVALAGVTNSTLLISTSAQATLSAGELERAIAHERAHERASDNLKKLLLRAVTFPGMKQLETAWLQAIELSADAEAVHSHAEALDLASALVKIARLHREEALPELISGLVDSSRSGLENRVDRLLHWTPERSHESAGRHLRLPLSLVLVLVVCNYPALLQGVHAMTELIIR